MYSLGTPWGLLEDSLETPWGLLGGSQDFIGTPWGLLSNVWLSVTTSCEGISLVISRSFPVNRKFLSHPHTPTLTVAAAKAAMFRKNRTTVGRKLAKFL